MSKPDYEKNLDDLFLQAFETNEPAMISYAQLKMELKRLRSLSDDLTKGNILILMKDDLSASNWHVQPQDLNYSHFGNSEKICEAPIAIYIDDDKNYHIVINRWS